MTGIIITARIESSRIYKKIFSLINGIPAIEILLKRLSDFDNVIIAVPAGESDYYSEFIKRYPKVKIFSGAFSPLHRLNECCKLYGFDDFVRITCDDILIDAGLLKKQIEYHERNQNDYTYMGRCPFGVAGELISARAIKTIAERENGCIEFVSYYLKNGDFKFSEYFPPVEYRKNVRVSLDYPEDLKLLKILFSLLGDKFGTLDVINLYNRHPEIWEINRQPVITFYTCNYNYSRYISECIQSVINQTIFNESEYIILDDCSTDDSLKSIHDTIETYPYYIRDRIQIVKNIKNKNLPGSSNRCLDLARGRYVMRIDSDDTIYPTLAEKLLNKIDSTGADACISGFIEEGAVQPANHRHPACCILKKHIVQNLRYKEDLKIGEGTEFFKRFEKQYKLETVNEPLWTYRRHPDSKTAVGGN